MRDVTSRSRWRAEIAKAPEPATRDAAKRPRDAPDERAPQHRHDALARAAPPVDRAREPRKRHQLRFDEDEEAPDERRAHDLGGDDDRDAERRAPVLDQPQRGQLDGKEEQRGDEEERERDVARRGADRPFERGERRPARDRGGERGERPPAPLLDEEDDDEEREKDDPKRPPQPVRDPADAAVRRSRRLAINRRRASFSPRPPRLRPCGRGSAR